MAKEKFESETSRSKAWAIGSTRATTALVAVTAPVMTAAKLPTGKGGLNA